MLGVPVTRMYIYVHLYFCCTTACTFPKMVTQAYQLHILKRQPRGYYVYCRSTICVSDTPRCVLKYLTDTVTLFWRWQYVCEIHYEKCKHVFHFYRVWRYAMCTRNNLIPYNMLTGLQDYGKCNYKIAYNVPDLRWKTEALKVYYIKDWYKSLSKGKKHKLHWKINIK